MQILEEVFWPHYGWVSEDDVIVWQWQVLYSENMDLSTDTKSVTLSRELENVMNLWNNAGWITRYRPRRIFFSSAWILVSTDGNRLIRYSSGTKTEVWDGEEVRLFWEYGDYIYMVDNDYDIHRISIWDAQVEANWTSFITTTDTSMTNTSLASYNISVNWEITYLWFWNSLYAIDNATWTVDTTSTYNFLDEDDIIIGITYASDIYKVYTQKWDIYYWRGIWSESWEERGNIWNPLVSVVQDWGTDWAVWYGGIGYINWFDYVPLTSEAYSDELNSDKLKIDNRNFNLGQTFTRNVYGLSLTGQDSGLSLTDWTNAYGWAWILSFGRKSELLPFCYNLTNTYSAGWVKIARVYFIERNYTDVTKNAEDIYIGFEDTDWNYLVEKTSVGTKDFTTHTKPWVVIYPTFLWQDPNRSKKWTEIEVRGYLSTWAELEIFYIDRTQTNNIVSIWTITWPSSEWIDNSRYILDFNDNFNELTIWYVLRDTNWLTRSNTSRIYNLKLKYEYTE